MSSRGKRRHVRRRAMSVVALPELDEHDDEMADEAVQVAGLLPVALVVLGVYAVTIFVIWVVSRG